MIDYIIMHRDIAIDEKKLSPMRWSARQGAHHRYYLFQHNSIKIIYTPETTKITVVGKISSLFSNSQVNNVDDIFGSDINTFIDSINCELRRVFEVDTIDIKTFTVTRIDYCFNVKTSHVTEYLEFMAAAFQHKNKGRRTDFTYERGLSGSIYIKPTREYKKNLKKTYCVNFYDKTDWINNQEKKGIHISDKDKELASDVLRLEVQCYSDKINRICEKNGIKNSFGDLCDIALAYNTICGTYKMLLGGDENCSYVKYEETKNIKLSPTVRRQLISSAQRHNITTYAAKEAIKRNIYPYYFLPAKWSIRQLKNPMMLICEKIEAMVSVLWYHSQAKYQA